MKNKKNSYLGVLDYALVEFLPQKAQYEVLRVFLNKKKNSLALYVMEDETTYLSSSQLLKKVNEKPKVKGFVFFSLLQISFEKKNTEIIKQILSNKYEIIFYKENIHIPNMSSYKKKFEKKILLFRHNNIKAIDRLKSLLKY